MLKTRGYAATTAGAQLAPFDFERRDPRAEDVVIEITHAGICHSDIHQAREEWGKAIFPMVPGHEIAGIVSEVGSSVRKFKIGDPIGVGVFVDSCRKCASCNSGDENYCEKNMTATYNDLERDGITPTYGGYANNFVVHEDYAVLIPKNLELSGVAPLLCAGITLYSPMKYWNVNSKSQVAIMGLGGLGHMGVKFAAALGADVTVLSHSPGKKGDALAMGAHHFVDTSSEAAFAECAGTFDVILNTVSAELDINKYLNLLKLDGTLVVIGLPGKPYAVHVGSLLSGRRSIGGSMIGGIPELQDMLNLCGEKSIVSDVEVIKADYINEAYERTVASDVKYRFVIDAKTF